MQILYFYVTTCTTCIVQKTVLDRISEEYSSVEVTRVDVDCEFDYVKKYSPTDAPELVFLKEGKEVDRLKGFQHKDSIEEVLNKFKNNKV